MRITSAGKVEMGSGGTYGSSPMTLNLGSRANNVAGSLAIARGEALGGGTGPYMELVHGPDGGTQRIHSIYSYIGDLRIVADSNENMEFHTGGSESLRITSDGRVRIGYSTDEDVHTGEGADLQVVSNDAGGLTFARDDTTVSLSLIHI